MPLELVRWNEHTRQRRPDTIRCRASHIPEKETDMENLLSVDFLLTLAIAAGFVLWVRPWRRDP